MSAFVYDFILVTTFVSMLFAAFGGFGFELTCLFLIVFAFLVLGRAE